MAVVATISADIWEGVKPLTVQFSVNIVSGNPASFSWDFGDGTYSTEYNPTHVYNTTGYHTVILTLVDSEYPMSETVVRMPGYIRVGDIAFTSDVVKGVPPLEVNFTNISAAPTGYQFTGWDWDYGDGSIHTSGETGATHIYNAYGNYNVILSANMFRT